jgi:hypothetical protein
MARPGYSLAVKGGGGGQVKTLNVTLHGMGLIAFEALTRKIVMPETGQIVGITLNAAAKGGTFPGSAAATVDVLAGATSVLAAKFDAEALVAGTPASKEGSALAAAAASVAKDTVISIATAVSGGTSPTWQGADIQIDYVPLGD